MSNRWEEELAILHTILQRTALKQTTKWGMPVYTFEGRNVVGVVGFKTHFTLWFYNGAFLSDPQGVLVNAQEGKTKSMRQWRFTSREQIDESLILAYIEEAIANEKAGKQLKSQPKGKLAVPPILADALTEATLKERFEQLTPYKQNEYIEYISEAKQEATKLKRLDKIKPLILQGIGLYEKYKK
jgi:Uncharacterized protein conserved in bacteria